MKNSTTYFGNYTSIALYFLTILLFSGCHATKEIHQLRALEQIEATKMENLHSTTEAATITDTKTTGETVVTESFDTVVSIMPVIGGVVADRPVSVPVKGTRTIHRKEFSDQKQTSQEKGIVVANRHEQILRRYDVQKEERQVDRTWFPGWLIIIFIVLIGAAVWIWRQ